MIKIYMLHILASVGHIIATFGYIGIIFFMALESSFIPFPSEIIITPAGFLSSSGKMHFWLVVLAGVIGSLIGSYVNYYIAEKYGRGFIIKYGRFFGINEKNFSKMEKFFNNHGAISTFVGRLIPGLRQYISFPAGLVKMNKIKFLLYTAFGAFVWVLLLATVGYYVGNNEKTAERLISIYSKYIFIGIILTIIIYIIWYKKRKKNEEKN